MKAFFSILLIILTCACSTHYETQDVQFYAYLEKNYRSYANYKQENHDRNGAKLFYKKANKIRKGIAVLPSNISNDLNKEISINKNSTDKQDNLTNRLCLILTNSSAKSDYPEEVADMQFYYDCWIAEKEGYNNYIDIARCKQGFTDTLEYLEYKLLKLTVNEQSMVTKKVDDEDEVIKYKKPKKYIIYFGFDSSVVDNEASKIIWQVIDDAQNFYGNYIINIVGHADRVGNAKYNINLSKRRTDTIKHYLIKNGISNNSIRENWAGEIDPGVITSNNTKEDINRRVVITIDKIE